MEFFVILTVQKAAPGGGGFELYTATLRVTLDPGSTRMGLYGWAREQLPERLRSGTVIFYSAEPNRLELTGGVQLAALADSIDERLENEDADRQIIAEDVAVQLRKLAGGAR